MNVSFAWSLGLLTAIIGLLPTRAASLTLDATTLLERSVVLHLQPTKERDAIELESGELFEDDGPAAGFSYQSPRNEEQLTVATWARKELVIPRPEARAAFLVVLSGDPVQAMLNDQPVPATPSQSGRPSFQAIPIPPSLLQAGKNTIVLRGPASLAIARADEFALGSRTRTSHPNRSAKSTDSGKTWDYDHLGPDGQLDGEYGIRIFLDHYRPSGSLTLGVIDAANLEGAPVGPPLLSLPPIQIAVDADPGPRGQIALRARAGPTPIPSAPGWSDWQPLPDKGGTIDQPAGRYLQIALEFSTRDALQSPRLRSLTVAASALPARNWTAAIRLVEARNEEIIRTSVPFEYEPLEHPRLRQLREEQHLDDVVRGARTELELMLRLAQWACNAWDWPNHIMERYPAWDALEILKPHRDGTPVGGFCQQFNLVFLQACESFGLNGRAISISQGRLQEQHPGGGHEVVELWSNEWRKWVYVDGALAWYVVDEATGVPLSIWELRERQLQLVHGQPSPPVRLVDAPRTRNQQFLWTGLGPPKPSNWYTELRLIPRSNFLQEQVPLPLSQGREEWSWTGSYVWTDSDVPAGLVFGERISRRRDFEWTLNQAHYVLEAGAAPGTLRVHLDTVTPSFETFLAEIDDAGKTPVASGFSWTLHPGVNQLRVRPRNLAGREGIPSSITLEYH